MAKRKKPTRAPRGKTSKRDGQTLVQAWVADDLVGGLEKLRTSQKYPPERAELVRRAIIDLLDREGFLPDAYKKEDGPKSP